MESENILAVNIPNTVSIGIMALVFGVVLALARWALGQAMPSNSDAGS